jgi:hypothetical protein
MRGPVNLSTTEPQKVRWVPPAVVYSYAPGGRHIHANTLLGSYRGILQCDGYGAYKRFGRPKSADLPVTLTFYWSHVRRGVYDLAKAKDAECEGDAATARPYESPRPRSSVAVPHLAADSPLGPTRKAPYE